MANRLTSNGPYLINWQLTATPTSHREVVRAKSVMPQEVGFLLVKGHASRCVEVSSSRRGMFAFLENLGL
jgi:hypothetical protein